MRTDIRFLQSDPKHPKGKLLLEELDIGATPIPLEFSRIRFEGVVGLYQVVEQGVLHYFGSVPTSDGKSTQRAHLITVAVELVTEDSLVES